MNERLPSTPLLIIEHLVMCFVLCKAPALFQALVNALLQEFLNVFVFVYFEDILVFSLNLSSHKQHVCQVFHRLLENNVRFSCHYSVISGLCHLYRSD